MTQGFDDEFATIKILVDSKTKTGRTDAFIVAFTKVEKQARRIFTYTIYQFPTFSLSDYKNILNTISSTGFLYFGNFVKGFDAIYPKSFEAIVGNALYDSFLKTEFPRLQRLRNKILHGQPTGQNLSASDLINEIEVIRKWCLDVAESMLSEIGFDGLEWNSFRKFHERDLASTYKVSISDVNGINAFIDSSMR